MKKLVLITLIGLLSVACSQDDDVYGVNEANSKSETLVQKGPPLIITEWVDLEFTESPCRTDKKRYQARAVSSEVYSRDRYISYKITDNTYGFVWHSGQYTIPAGSYTSAFGDVFSNENFAANVKYEITNVEINPYYYDSNGNLVYQPVIGLYQYKSGDKDVNNCQVPIFN